MSLKPATGDALTQLLRSTQAEQRVPSVAAAVVRGGERVWSDAVGHLDARADGPVATTDTQYRIGSITKTFVAVTVLRLRDEGRLALHDLVSDHLPELAHLAPFTVAQLLSHTAGIQAETSGPWWERTPGGSWDELLAGGIEQRLTPGTRFHYSNTGYAILGEVVARLTGRPWIEVVTDDVLTPLGMSRTTPRPTGLAAPGLAVHPFADVLHPEPEHDGVSLAPAGQLWSTADDLARWAAFLAGSTGDVLAPATLREMLHPVAVNDVPRIGWTGAHALGWQTWNVGGRRYAGHGGSMPGFLAALRVDVETGDGAVVLANATSGLGDVASPLLRRLTEVEPVRPEVWTAAPVPEGDLDLVGDWFWGPYRHTLKLEPGGGLRLGEPGEGRGARFERTADGWVGLEGYHSGEPLVVRRDGDTVWLELASFVFTRTPYDPSADVPGGTDTWT
ncbi:serine hydrolase domain-containing protein [Aeromicrobium sp. Root495]|uniref:serine hydrolase domain-containing protein n=1 Tax=Aeromicrobium sp. Root495 TaxID=1736550 RepID=UPI000A542729|nr:serine hydrolase domain-containing protein [Aeromicrobium sp. Root495]